jgi:hypothetical protein
MAVNNMTPTAALRLVIEEEMVNLRYSDYRLLNALSKANAFQQSIKWNINTSQTTASGRAVTASAASASSDTIANATLPIGASAYTETVELLRTDIVQARTAGVGALRDLVNAHFRSAITKILRSVNASLYVGDGSVNHAGITGLDSIYPQTGSYAGLDQGTYNAWKGAFDLNNSGSPQALSADLLRAAATAFYKSGTGDFDLIFCSPEVADEYLDLFSTDRALVTASVNGRADLGFSDLSYQGRPIVFDRDCPTDLMYCFDSTQLNIYSYGFPGMSDLETMNVGGLQFTMKELPSDSMYTTRFELGVAPQLKSHDRRAVGCISDLSV